VALSSSEDVTRAPASLLAGLARLKAWLTDGSDDSLARRAAGTAFMIRVGNAALAYLSQVLLARWMGSFEFGIYVYVWTWVLLIGSMVDLGIASSAQRFIPEYSDRQAFALLRGFLFGSRVLVLASSAILMLAGMLAVRLLEPWLDPYTVVPLYLACITLPLVAVSHVQETIARSYDWVNLSFLPPYILRQGALLAVMLLLFLAGFAVDAVAAMLASIAAIVIAGGGQWLMLHRRLAKVVARGVRSYEIKTWLATSLPIVIVEGFYLLLAYTDVLVLQQFRPPEEVAVYYAAAKTLALVAFIYFSVSATAAHKFSSYHVAGDRSRLRAFLAQAIGWTFWPSLAATILVLALGRPLLRLFGPGFSDGYHLMFLLAVGLLARSAVGPVERLLSMLGEQRVCAMVYAAAFALNLVLCIVLIPRFGGAGAAIATSAALVLESILLFFVTRSRLGFHVFVFGGRSQR
jgi:O-antigen/teichoic acid export membrane protein